MKRIEQIAQRFNHASATYEGAAALQRMSAELLAQRVLEIAWKHPNVLEIGCGTGYLTRLLLPKLPGQWLVTDIAPAMLEATRNHFPAGTAQFRILDGSNPDLPALSMNLIVSNLAAQWFEDLHTSLQQLARCLAPQGRLILTVLGENSLTQWRTAVAAQGRQSGTPNYPTANTLSGILPHSQVSSRILTLSYADARSFLNSLKAIGATVPAAEYSPLPAPVLRQAMKQMGAPCAISYEILTLDWIKRSY